jgi:integrase
MPKLSAVRTRSLTTPGRYTDGDGLHLYVRDQTHRFWVLRYRFGGRQRDMGFGRFPEVSLAEARELARRAREQLRQGSDPLDAREAHRTRIATEAAGRRDFRTVAEDYIAAHESSWRNDKHRAQWRSTLETYAYPQIGTLPVTQVSRDHVLGVLKPIWKTKTETAKRLRGRIETVLDFAIANDWRGEPNPARWRGHLAKLLPPPSRLSPVEHHAALAHADMPEFMQALRARVGTAARAFEFTILTAARTSEVLGARWNEMDLVRSIWTVPAARTKAAREHRVPLSKPASAILNAMRRSDPAPNDYVFANESQQALSSMAFLMLLRRMERTDITVHGFRSTFRDWVSEATTHPREVAEMALAHVNKDKTEAAYARSDLFDKRAELLAEWAAHCAEPGAARAHGGGRKRRAKGVDR